VRLAGLAVSLVVAAVLLGPWLRDMARSGLARQNYRGRAVAFPAGAVLVACSLVALVPLAVLDDRADLDLLDPELRRWAVYVLGVALLGLMDDALGRGPDAAAPRGWRAHARAVAAGRFSTGFIKAVGALGLAAYATSGLGRHDLGYVADLVLLLLTTNLFNLLDLRPGRVERSSSRCSRGSASALGRWRPLTCSGCSSGRSWWGRRSRFASAQCSAIRAPTWSGRSPESRS
jgi:hypothetical protein